MSGSCAPPRLHQARFWAAVTILPRRNPDPGSRRGTKRSDPIAWNPSTLRGAVRSPWGRSIPCPRLFHGPCQDERSTDYYQRNTHSERRRLRIAAPLIIEATARGEDRSCSNARATTGHENARPTLLGRKPMRTCGQLRRAKGERDHDRRSPHFEKPFRSRTGPGSRTRRRSACPAEGSST